MIQKNDQSIFLSVIFLLFVLSVVVMGGQVNDFQEPSAPKTVKPNEANPRLQTVLQYIGEESGESLSRGVNLAKDKNLPVSDGKITIIIEPVGNRSDAVDMAVFRII